MKNICVLKEIKWGIQSSEKIKRVLCFTVIAVLWSVQTVQAQDLPNKMWHPGRIVLEQGDTITGVISYDFKTNIIQYKNDKKVKTFSSQQVLYVEFNCQFFRRFRYFYSIPYNIKGSLEIPVFFEILAEGKKVTLMAREYVVIENSSQYVNPYNTFNNTSSFSREVLTYDYYFLTSAGEIRQFEEKKRDLYSFFGNETQEMKNFIKDHNLNYNKQGDLVKIINHFNNI